MYSNNGISYELANLNFVPLVHSKVKSASSKSRYVAIIEPEPAGFVISMFCRNTAPNASKNYLTRNVPRTNEPVQPVNPTFRRNATHNASENYLTRNVPRTNEPFRPVNPAFCGILARNEPVGHRNPAFRENNALIKSKMYLRTLM